MLKIQARNGYALRIMQYLVQREPATVTAGEMSENMGISYLYMMKILNKMRIAGLVESEQGCYGGYHLIEPANELSVLDVYHATDGELVLL